MTIVAEERHVVEHLDPRQIAYLTGGPERVVLTSLVSLLESDVIRVRNPVAAASVAQVAQASAKTDRMAAANKVAADRTVNGATVFAPGDGQAIHPVDQQILATCRYNGRISYHGLQEVPAIKALERDLVVTGLLRPRPKAQVAVVLTGVAALLAGGVAALAAFGEAGFWAGLAVTVLGLMLLGGLYALHDALGPVSWTVRRALRNRAAELGLEVEALREGVTGGPSLLPASTVLCVALVGGLALWVASPEVAAAIGSAAAPGVGGDGYAAGGCGGCGGGGCGGGCGGCGGCG